MEGLEGLLAGPTAIAFIQGEPVDAAKAIKRFARENPGLTIKGGYMDGRALSTAEVEQLADLESREVMLSQLAGAMKANLSKAAGLFAAPASQVARMAQALADKQADGAPAAEAPAEASSDADAEADAPAEAATEC